VSDESRDRVAEGLGDALVFLFGNPVTLILMGVGAFILGVGALLSGFPLKKHKWCGGKGHWGIGPFRRRCGACSGSGLVER
jgi:hypothetical protein